MSEERTVLGPTIEVEGEIEGDEDLIVQGTIRGKIASQKDVTVDDGGNVEATVKTRNLAISGRLTGNVEASDRVEVRAVGTMNGDVKAPRVVLADGAKFKGNIQMEAD